MVYKLYFTVIVSSGCLADYQLHSPDSKNRPLEETSPKAESQTPRDAVVSIDPQTFRFRKDFNAVWYSALEILIRNYNLNLVNKKSGLLTTEWDSYYIGSTLYRNKLTLRIRRAAWKFVDVTIYNNVETLKESNGSIRWIPNKDSATEMHRIVKNMAVFLDQSAPPLPDKISISKN